MNSSIKGEPSFFSLEITVLYLLFGGLWRLASDQLISMLIGDPVVRQETRAFEDITFIIATGLILYFLLRRFEKALRENNERYRQLVESLPDGVLIQSGDAIVFANAAGITLMGVASLSDRLIHHSIMEFLPEAGRDTIQEAIQKAQKGTEVTLGEQKLIRYDGKTIDVEITAIPYWYGDTQAAQLIVHDITRRKNAQYEVYRQKHELEAIYRTIPDAAIFENVNREIMLINPAFTQLFGYAQEEIIGNHTKLLYANQADYEEQGRIRFNPDAKEDLSRYEINYRRKAGDVFIGETVGTVMHDGEGHIIGMLAIIRDVTESKQAEEMLRRQAEIIDQTHDAVVSTDLDGFVTSWNMGAERMFGYTASEALGRHIAFMYREEQREFLDRDVIKPLKEKGRHEIEVRMQHRTGKDFYVHLSLTLLRNSRNQVTGMIGYSMDITERKHAEAEREQAYRTLERRVEARTQEIERRRQVAEGLRDILTILNSNQSLEEIIGYIASQAARLLGNDADAIFRLQEAEEILVIQTARGLPNDYVTEVIVPVGQGPVGRAVVEQRAVVVPDVADLYDDPELNSQMQGFIQRLGEQYHAMIAVPLLIRERVYGAISLYYREPREFSDEEIELAVAFSAQAALAIENARLYAEGEKAAVAAERNRLARDLHDAVTQTLFSSTLIAEVLPTIWEMQPAEGRKRLMELRELTRGALAEMRSLLFELRPTTLTEVPLSELLRQLAEALTGRARVPVELVIEADHELSAEVQVVFYRIAQEALNNVSKHARANEIKVRLHAQPAYVKLQIQDNGRGFDPNSISPEHLGLGIMKERAEAIHATVEIQSQPGQGTLITAIWSDVQGG